MQTGKKKLILKSGTLTRVAVNCFTFFYWAEKGNVTMQAVVLSQHHTAKYWPGMCPSGFLLFPAVLCARKSFSKCYHLNDEPLNIKPCKQELKLTQYQTLLLYQEPSSTILLRIYKYVIDQRERVIPMRAWNRLLWKISMTLWMECRSCRSSARWSLARYSSSSSRARCASEQ